MGTSETALEVVNDTDIRGALTDVSRRTAPRKSVVSDPPEGSGSSPFYTQSKLGSRRVPCREGEQQLVDKEHQAAGEAEPEQQPECRGQGLVQALPGQIVLAQVQVSRVLGVKRRFNFYEWNNRIDRLSYDFVVCAMDSSVLAVIELDDKSHESKTRHRTDAKKNRAMSAAGIRMIRWNVKAMPDQDFIREAFAEWPTIATDAQLGAHRR